MSENIIDILNELAKPTDHEIRLVAIDHLKKLGHIDPDTARTDFGYKYLANLIRNSLGQKQRIKKVDACRFLRHWYEHGKSWAPFVRTKRRRLNLQNKPIKPPTRPQTSSPPKPRYDPAYTRAKYLAFLESQEWYRFRYEVLRRHGPVCALCRATGVPIQVDHIVPASVDRSRRLDPTNAQPLCRPCNVGKSNLYSDD